MRSVCVDEFPYIFFLKNVKTKKGGFFCMQIYTLTLRGTSQSTSAANFLTNIQANGCVLVFYFLKNL